MSAGDEGEVPILKVMLVGDKDIGKTTFAFCWKEDAPAGLLEYERLYSDGDICKAKLNVGDQEVMVHVRDTAGQEALEAIVDMAYMETDIFLLLFSCEDVNSLERIRSKWAPRVFQVVKNPRAMVLLGVRGNVRENYQELEARGESPFGESPVKDEMIQKVMREIGADCFVECCPQINYSVQEAMARAVEIYLEVEQKGPEEKKGPGNKHRGTRKRSKCNVA